MTELDKMIAAAYASAGKQDDVNKVYLLLLRSLLYVPVKKDKNPDDEEPFYPLFAHIEGQYYLMAFDTIARLQTWAGDHFDHIAYVELSGQDLITGLNEGVFLYINHGTDYYKEFPPEEVKHLKMIVSRIQQMKNS